MGSTNYKLKWFDRDQIPAEIYRHTDVEFGYNSESDDDNVYPMNMTWIRTNSVAFHILF